MKTIEELTATARELASSMFRNDPDSPTQCTGTGDQSCLTKEEERPLSRKEKALDWMQRPFHAYDPEKMCIGCRAYWFAEMAAQTLEHINYWA